MSLPCSTRRILRDLKQWKECSSEVPTINASPLPNDIYEWHANMTAKEGPLKGIKFHLIINFPKNYPYCPPSIELCTYLKHPNVFKTGIHGDTKSNEGYWLCLDMLKEYTRSNKYKGWTSAYSVVSLLLQLQSFLIGDKVEQDYGSTVELKTYLTKDIIQQIKNEAEKYKCNKCDHLPDYKHYQTEMQISNNFKVHSNGWVKLYDDVENQIISYLTFKDCVYFNHVCKQFRWILERNKIFELNRFGCWYHKIDLNYCQKTLYEYKKEKNKQMKLNKNIIDDDVKEDSNNFEDEKVLNNMILGYGFTPVFYRRLSEKPYFGDYFNDVNCSIRNVKNMKFLRLQQCDVTFDLLSYDAFRKHGIRTTVWKEKDFTNFLPIYINKKHGEKSLGLFEEICLKIFATEASSKYQFVPTKYHPMMGIHLLMTIMSSLVVNVTKNCDSLYGNKPNLHYSINVIETYMHLYHMLLAIYDKYNNCLQPFIDEKCMNFVNSKDLRTKTYCPNLGTFRIFFVLQNKYKWNDIVQPFVDEAFIRKVKWVVKDYSSLRTVSSNDDKDYRINKTWSTSKKRGFTFQYFFLNYCCQIGIKSPLDTLKEFNNNFGCPPKHLPGKFQRFVKQIYSTKDIYAFFDTIGIKNTNKEYVYNLLANACKKSLKNGYHREYRRTNRRYW